jgi:hypothetical protein
VVTLPTAADGSFAEPGIAADRGLAMIDAASANTGAVATLWSSTDDGCSWTAGRGLDPTGASTGDADVAFGADGVRYSLDLGYGANPPAQPTNPTVYVFRSRDGRHWQGPASFPAPHGSDQPDRPWLMPDPRHPAHVLVVNSEGGGNIVAWQSTDHAATFTGPVPVSGGVDLQAGLALSSRPLFDPTDPGRVFMFFETVSPAALEQTLAGGLPLYEFPMTQLWLAVSTDGGASWSQQQVLDTESSSDPRLHAGLLGHLLVASAIDPAGRLYLAVSLRRPPSTATDIYLLHSTDHGAAWSSAYRLPSPAGSNVMPAIAATASSVYASWYASPSSDFTSAAARWYELLAAVRRPLSAHPVTEVTRLTASPVHLGGIDTAGALATDPGHLDPALGANWGLRDFQSISVDRHGRPLPVWANDAGRGVTQTLAEDCTARPG